jgi:hypothetical protein
MAILSYLCLFLVISPWVTFGYFKLFFVVLGYFFLSYFFTIVSFLAILCFFGY